MKKLFLYKSFKKEFPRKPSDFPENVFKKLCKIGTS